MAEYDMKSLVKVVPAINPASAADISDGASIDTRGYESVTFIVQTGAIGAGTVGFKIQHADDNGSGAPGTFADIVAADDLIGSYPAAVATTDNNKTFWFGYRGKKRWVRLQNIETATWTTAIHGASCVLANPKRVPTA